MKVEVAVLGSRPYKPTVSVCGRKATLNHQAYWGRGEGGMEVGEEGDYIPVVDTVSTRMTPALS